MTNEVEATLISRGARYGTFRGNAEVAQAIKFVFASSPSWCRLKADQKEGLELIASKLGRILSGDPNYTDSWHDIAGYAKLVEDELLRQESM